MNAYPQLRDLLSSNARVVWKGVMYTLSAIIMLYLLHLDALLLDGFFPVTTSVGPGMIAVILTFLFPASVAVIAVIISRKWITLRAPLVFILHSLFICLCLFILVYVIIAGTSSAERDLIDYGIQYLGTSWMSDSTRFLYKKLKLTNNDLHSESSIRKITAYYEARCTRAAMKLVGLFLFWAPSVALVMIKVDESFDHSRDARLHDAMPTATGP